MAVSILRMAITSLGGSRERMFMALDSAAEVNGIYVDAARRRTVANMLWAASEGGNVAKEFSLVLPQKDVMLHKHPDSDKGNPPDHLGAASFELPALRALTGPRQAHTKCT
jgi:hypothetical protein